MKTRRFLIISILFLLGSTTYSIFPEGVNDEPEVKNFSPDTTQAQKAVDVEQIIEYAEQFIGVRYMYGGSTPKGFDCSGFIQYVYKKFNCYLPRSAAAQGEVGDLVETKDYQPGDLIFFTGSKKIPGRAGHVGMIVKVHGENDFDFIHAYSPKKKGIIVQNIRERKKAYLFVRRIFQ